MGSSVPPGIGLPQESLTLGRAVPPLPAGLLEASSYPFTPAHIQLIGGGCQDRGPVPSWQFMEFMLTSLDIIKGVEDVGKWQATHREKLPAGGTQQPTSRGVHMVQSPAGS